MLLLIWRYCIIGDSWHVAIIFSNIQTVAVLLVPDRRRRIVPEVVLVKRWVIGVLGILRGEGLGKGSGQGRSVYKQPETEVDGSCHS
jgi:hypothetical protein